MSDALEKFKKEYIDNRPELSTEEVIAAENAIDSAWGAALEQTSTAGRPSEEIKQRAMDIEDAVMSGNMSAEQVYTQMWQLVDKASCQPSTGNAYCKDCQWAGHTHCAHPDECGGMSSTPSTAEAQARALEDFAVFVQSGEEWNQLSVWLPLWDAQNYLRSVGEHFPFACIFKRIREEG